MAAVADVSVCPILTLDVARWREHEEDLDQRLYVIEVADPPDQADDQNAGSPE